MSEVPLADLAAQYRRIRSEVDEAVASVNQMGQAVERGVVIEKLIEKQLVVQEARRQHVTVNPDDIDEQVDAEIESIKRRLGGEDGLARIIKSPCPHRFCIRSGAINRPGAPLVCVPNGVVVELVGGRAEMDGTTR